MTEGRKLKTDIVSHNRALFGHQSVVERYRRVGELQPPEAAIISWIGHEFEDKRILDLGVGGGRTTPYLLDISKNYIGIDFSPAMIAACQVRYPEVSFAVGDARDLSRFPVASFDLVMFSQNGIDCVDHAGRLQALAEIRRILTSDGALVFSSRNRHFKFPRPWDIRRLQRQPASFTRPSQLFEGLRTYGAGIYHYLRHRSQESHTEEYAIGTSEFSNYDTLLYAISIDAQLAQLRRIGFQDVAVVGYKDPRVLRPDEYAGCNDPWLHYVCHSITRLTPSPT
jgi:ubiquinone/menaquinone biosynthesis C-methylase UbiE